jgi:hypothetical protein
MKKFFQAWRKEIKFTALQMDNKDANESVIKNSRVLLVSIIVFFASIFSPIVASCALAGSPVPKLIYSLIWGFVCFLALRFPTRFIVLIGVIIWFLFLPVIMDWADSPLSTLNNIDALDTWYGAIYLQCLNQE